MKIRRAQDKLLHEEGFENKSRFSKFWERFKNLWKYFYKEFMLTATIKITLKYFTLECKVNDIFIRFE